MGKFLEKTATWWAEFKVTCSEAKHKIHFTNLRCSNFVLTWFCTFLIVCVGVLGSVGYRIWNSTNSLQKRLILSCHIIQDAFTCAKISEEMDKGGYLLAVEENYRYDRKKIMDEVLSQEYGEEATAEAQKSQGSFADSTLQMQEMNPSLKDEMNKAFQQGGQ